MDVDYLAFVAERVSQLRAAKGVSANDMSLSIGQSRNYIRHLEKREIVPSLQVLFFICDYFKISPQEFFEQGNRHPDRLNNFIADVKCLNDSTFFHLTDLVKDFVKNQKQ